MMRVSVYAVLPGKLRWYVEITMRVGLILTFFPHYRSAVNQMLAHRSDNDYTFFGDILDPEHSIEPWLPDPDAGEPFVRTRSVYLGKGFLYQSGLIRAALRRDLDVLIYMGNWQYFMNWPSVLLAKLTGKRVLFWTHGWIRNDAGLKDWLRRTFYRLADGLMVYGHIAKNIGIAKGFDPQRIYVIYNSLDYDWQKQVRAKLTESDLHQTRAELFEDPDRPVVICTTRLIAIRGLDMLLDAVAQLDRAGRKLNVLLVGDGPEKEALQAQAARDGLSVCFYGACYDEARLGRLLMASNCTVAPGKVGLAAMHGLAFGIPVISHDDPDHQMPEFEAIMPGITGSLFTRGHVDALVDAIEYWTRTPRVSDQTRAACYRMIDRFFNPQMQQRCIDRAVDGLPADDLFWLKQ